MNSKTSPWRLRIRALLPALLVAILASPAIAAGTADPDLRICLKYSNGALYTGKPIYLYRYEGIHDGAWIYTNRVQNAGSDGCTIFVDVRPDYWFNGTGYWYYAVGNVWWIHKGGTPDVYVRPVYPDAQWYVFGVVPHNPVRFN